MESRGACLRLQFRQNIESLKYSLSCIGPCVTTFMQIMSFLPNLTIPHKDFAHCHLKAL